MICRSGIAPLATRWTYRLASGIAGRLSQHALPQKWQTHWPVDGLEAEIVGGAHVHRLGNLTLLTESMNSAISNGPWHHERERLAKYDVFLMNRLFHEQTTEAWDEDRIDARSRSMLESLMAA